MRTWLLCGGPLGENINDCMSGWAGHPNAGIAQLGEQQTEVLEVACSIHAPGIFFSSCASTLSPCSRLGWLWLGLIFSLSALLFCSDIYRFH